MIVVKSASRSLGPEGLPHKGGKLGKVRARQLAGISEFQSCRSCLLREIHAAKQIFEPRIAAQRIPEWGPLHVERV